MASAASLVEIKTKVKMAARASGPKIIVVDKGPGPLFSIVRAFVTIEANGKLRGAQ